VVCLLVDGVLDLQVDFVDFVVTLDVGDHASFPVVCDDGCSLRVEQVDAVLGSLLVVILALHQRFASLVVPVLLFGRLEIYVVRAARLLVDASAGDSALEVAVADVQRDDRVDAALEFGELRVQDLGLVDGAGEAVEQNEVLVLVFADFVFH